MTDSDHIAGEDKQKHKQQIPTSWQDDLQWSARRLGAAIWAGALPGLLIGGIGGRLAMLVLRLTSDPRLHGVETDDGFVIGEITGDTLFLILVGTALGAIGGLFYFITRSWLPEKTRPFAMAALAGLVGGAVVIRPEGIDFRLLDPLMLAIAMFVVLPAVYGFAVSMLAERLFASAEAPRFAGWVPALLPLAGVLVVGPIGFVVLVVATLGWSLNRISNVADWWTSTGMAWVGRGALLVAGAFAGYALIKDVFEVLWPQRLPRQRSERNAPGPGQPVRPSERPLFRPRGGEDPCRSRGEPSQSSRPSARLLQRLVAEHLDPVRLRAIVCSFKRHAGSPSSSRGPRSPISKPPRHCPHTTGQRSCAPT